MSVTFLNIQHFYF